MEAVSLRLRESVALVLCEGGLSTSSSPLLFFPSLALTLAVFGLDIRDAARRNSFAQGSARGQASAEQSSNSVLQEG